MCLRDQQTPAQKRHVYMQCAQAARANTLHAYQSEKLQLTIYCTLRLPIRIAGTDSVHQRSPRFNDTAGHRQITTMTRVLNETHVGVIQT